ncbi:MAG: hypothetical protein WCQ90_05360, partial [Deltaproteobacteria bacterium]
QKWMEKEGYMLFSAHQGDDRLYSGPEAAFEEYIEASNTQDAIKSSDYAKLAENFLKIKEGSEDLYKNKLDKFKKEHPDQYDKLVNAIKNKSALPKITDTKPPPEHAEHKDEKIPAVQTAAVPSSGKGRPGTAGTLNTPAPGKPQPPVDPTLITDEKGNLKPGYSIDKYGMAWSDKPSYILVKGPDGKWHDEIIKQTSAAAASTSGLSAPKQFPDAAQPPPPKTDAGNIQPYSYPPDFEYFLNMKWHGPNICQKGYDEIAQLLAKGNPDALNPFNTSYKANIIVEGQDHGIFYTVSDGKLQKVWTENPLDVNDPGITVWKMEGGRLVGIQGLKE